MSVDYNEERNDEENRTCVQYIFGYNNQLGFVKLTFEFKNYRSDRVKKKKKTETDSIRKYSPLFGADLRNLAIKLSLLQITLLSFLLLKSYHQFIFFFFFIFSNPYIFEFELVLILRTWFHKSFSIVVSIYIYTMYTFNVIHTHSIFSFLSWYQPVVRK